MTSGTLPKLMVLVITLLISAQVRAQFTPGILANDSYWSDGKAEFDIYDAQLMRNGELRHCEALHILLRERIDPKNLARVDEAKPGGAIHAVRMQQIWNAPIGIFLEQVSIAAYWRLDTFSLAELNLAGTDSFGNVMMRFEQKNSGPEMTWNFARYSYRAGSTTGSITMPPNAYFADELPLRVRTIDFTKPPVEFDIQLALPIAGTDKAEEVKFAPAKVSWRPVERSIEVTVQGAKGRERFVLDREFPFLLREWNTPDGSKLKLKRGLKADYWNYGKNGDRERALKNPMLQHPD